MIWWSSALLLYRDHHGLSLRNPILQADEDIISHISAALISMTRKTDTAVRRVRTQQSAFLAPKEIVAVRCLEFANKNILNCWHVLQKVKISGVNFFPRFCVPIFFLILNSKILTNHPSPSNHTISPNRDFPEIAGDFPSKPLHFGAPKMHEVAIIWPIHPQRRRLKP